MTTPRDASQVLAKCACYDPTFSRPDPAIAQAWAEAFDRYQLELPDLLAAVTRHYVESTDRAMPAHLVKHAREIRRDRAERENADPEQRAINEQERDRRLRILSDFADRKAVGDGA